MARKRKPAQKKRREEEAFLKEPGFKKVDIGRKLIPLSVLSGKEAEKNAERTIDCVFEAVTHVLSEGDLSIVDFGRFKASKTKKTGFIKIAFTPSGKLKRAVEARLNAVPSPDPDAESEAASAPESQPVPVPDPQVAPSVDTPPDPVPQPEVPPAPEQEPAPEVTPDAGPSADPATTLAEETAPLPDAPGEPAVNTAEPSGTYESEGTSETADSYEPAAGTYDQGGSYEAAGSYASASGEYGTYGSYDSTIQGEGPQILTLDSVSVENRTLVADSQEYGIADNLTIFDTNGNEMSFSDQAAALQHLTLASKITILSKTAFRIQAASVVEIITSLQIIQYWE